MTRNINLFVSSSATAIESPADIENGASASYQIYSVDGVLLKMERFQVAATGYIYIKGYRRQESKVI